MSLTAPFSAARTLVKVVVSALVVAVTGVVVLFAGVVPAWASHFRAAEFSWSRTTSATNVVSFSMTASYRRDYNGWTYYAAAGGGTKLAPNVGDVLADGNTRVYFGDGAVIDPYLQVTTVDAANNLITVEAINSSSPTSGHLTHTYQSGGGTYTAQLSSCCRLGSPTDTPRGGHINNPDKSMLVTTLVNLGSHALQSVSSSLPPVVDCPKNSPCNFTVPASFPSDETVSYRLSTAAEATDLTNYASSGSFIQPDGAAVSSTGLFTWNTTNKPLAPAPLDTYYSAQVTITANAGTAAASSVAVDFFLRITNQANNPPVWSTTTPADGTIINATPGVPVHIGVGATDPDAGASVTLAALNKPAAATFTTAAANPATGSFDWTPSVPGTSVINFTATDQNGLSALQRTVTISVAKNSPTIVWPTPASVVFGTALDGTQLDAVLSSAAGAAVPPHPGTFTYTPASGAVLHGGDNTLSVTWTPDPADAAGWNAVTSTVTLHVNQAAQSLSFNPAIDDSVTHIFGDAPFSVTAVSSAGLPVSYSVGSADACTSTPQPDGSTNLAVTASGNCTVSADQAGNADYSAAATISHSFTIAKKTPQLTLAPAGMTYGTGLGAAQLDASLSPSAAADHGTIDYLVDGNPVAAGDVIPAGTHTLTATFTAAADSSYNDAATTAELDIAQAPQTITFGSLGDATVGDAAFGVHASADSGLPVAFSSASAACSVTSDGTLTVLHAGTCTVNADQAGDNNYLPASRVAQSFTVHQAAQSISFASPGDHTYLDAPVALSASGGASGLAVTFAAMPPNVCSVDGTNNLLINGAGDCTITASQAGNGDYSAADDVVRVITIHKATPTVSWSAPAPITYGTALGSDQLNATVLPAGIAGEFTYTLADGVTPASGAVLHAGSAPQQLLATFIPSAPDDDNYVAASGQTTIVVNKADQAITWTNVPASATYGDAPFTVAATGGASGNAVAFSAGAGSTCSVSGSTVTINAAGPCVLAADQAGNGDYNAAPTSQRSLTVAQQTPTINWPTPAHITYGAALGAGQLNATVTPSAAAAAGSLGYSTDAGSGAAAGQVLHAGTHTLTATYTPDGSAAGSNFTAATATVNLVVDQASQAITGFVAPGTQTYGATPLTLTASGGASGKPVYFTVDAGSTCATSGTNGRTLTLTGAGSCTVIAHQDGTADYNAAPDVARTFQILQAQQAITFGALADGYVGDPAAQLNATGGGSGNPVTFVAGPSATCTVTPTGLLTITGPGTCTVTASQAGNSNYLAAPPVSRSFPVAYRVCVLSDQTKVNNSGSTVPIQVALCNSAGARVGSSSTIVLHATNVDTGPVNAAGNSQPGNNFRYTADGVSYQFNLQTTGLTGGTHYFYYTVGADPTRHSVTVLIRLA
jgi:hypothetical protein